MSSSPKQEQLRQLLDEQYASLRHTFPSDKRRSLLALIRARDWHFLASPHIERYTTSHDVHGWQKALTLCFSASAFPTSIERIDDTLDTWANTLLQACGCLAEGERILDHCETGFLHMQQRNGINALLGRLDQQHVKHLKAQNMYIFVLGRYLAHFFDEPYFHTHVAWGTWPQVLRLVHANAFAADDANPMQSLYNKLVRDTPLTFYTSLLSKREIVIGDASIHIYPSFEAYKNTF